MKITEISGIIHTYLGESQAWDNDGVMIELDNEINKIALCLDVTSKNVKKAKAQNADAIISHHPLIFKPVSSLCGDGTSKRIFECVKNNISVASFHTCLDVFDGGVNDVLCERLDIQNVRHFVPYGRIGTLKEEKSFEEFCKNAECALKSKPFQVVKSKGFVNTVAVVGGCGKDELYSAYLAGADTFLTGEASHSAMIEAEELGINLVCFGHFETENIILPRLKGIIEKLFPNIEVFIIGT